MRLKSSVLAACGIGLFFTSHSYAGLTFNIQYSAAVQANTNFSSIQSAVTYVENEFSALYTDNITLNFKIDQAAGGLGSSLFSNNYWRGDYTTLRNALVGDATTANDATATTAGNLPVAAPYAPTGGLTSADDWYAASAEAKALGLAVGSSDTCGGSFVSGNCDGTYTFASDQTYTYDPANRAVSGKFDFIGVTEHEFSELMGRTQQANTFGYDIFDTMRFTSVGTRNVNLSGVSGVYFSFDNGNTNLAGFNAGGGDKQDFDGTFATDPFNASTPSGQAHSLNEVDKSLLDVIGYNRVGAVPEPSTFLVAIPLLGFGLIRLRKRAQA